MHEASNLSRLQQQFEELQRQYDLLSDNIRCLYDDYYNNHEAHKRLPLERKLNQEEALRKGVEEQLKSVSKKIDALNQNRKASESVAQKIELLEATLLNEELKKRLKERDAKIRRLEDELKKKDKIIEELEEEIRILKGSEDFFEQHQEGEILTGVIKNIHPRHGIFVELAPDATGLARRETLDSNFIRLFSVGERIPVEIKKLNKQERKLELIVKAHRVIAKRPTKRPWRKR